MLKKIISLCLFVLLTILNDVHSQIPISYYDFESNSNRNIDIETSQEASVNGIGSPTILASSLTADHNLGNGTSISYGGSNTGFALGYYGFTTNIVSASTDPNIKFGPFNCSGLFSMSVSFDVRGLGTQRPTNVDLYWSTNNITYTRVVATNTVSSSYSTKSFTLPNTVNNVSTVYLMIVGFGAGATPSSSDGTMLVDNFTLFARDFRTSKTLMSAVTHGAGLSSGGSFIPTYTSIIVNNASANVTASSELMLGNSLTTTAVALTNGNLVMGNNNLTIYNSNSPITRTNGKLNMGSLSTLSFGTNSITDNGGAANLPVNLFTTNPVTFQNVIINRTNSISLANNFIIDGGSLILRAGRFGVGGITTTFQNTDIPIQKFSGTIGPNASSSIAFGSSGNTQGATFVIPNNTFLTSPSLLVNLTINRDNAITLGNQTFTISNNLQLISGTLNDNGNSITVQNNITGTGTHTGTGNITMTGSAKTISGATLGNLVLNNIGGFSLIGSAIITGQLSLTSGNLNVGSNTLTFHSGNTPISRTSGTINLTSSSSLAFGSPGFTGGTSFTIPDNTFSSSNPEFLNFTINRTNALTLNNQNFAINGILSLTSGNLILPLNYNFTLRSTSIANTALVNQVGAAGTISYGSGSEFTVERFIPNTPPAGKRVYRDIASAVYGSRTIFSTWQENGSNGLNNGIYYGTHITGRIGASPGGTHAGTGFDMTLAGTKSLHTNFVNLTTGISSWLDINSTNQVNDTLSPFRGYRVFIRGNRLIDLYQNPSSTVMNDAVTLRSRGRILIGNVAYSTTGVTANGFFNSNFRLNSSSASGFTMIPNPYVAPLDWHLVYDDASTLNIAPTYQIFDPYNGTNGGYATYNRLTGIRSPLTSNINRYIQPGQSFFIQNTSTSPSITFREAHKAVSASNLTLVFKNTFVNKPTLMSIDLEKKTTNGNIYQMYDGIVFCLNDNFSNQEGLEDSRKMLNPNNNISFVINNQDFSIEGRRTLSKNDVINIKLQGLEVGGDYRLSIDANSLNVSKNLSIYLVDKLLNKRTKFNNSEKLSYPFNINDSDSYNNRFYILFDSNELITLTSQIQQSNFNIATMKIFPNPFKSGKLSIQVSNLDFSMNDKFQVEIINSLGITVYSQTYFQSLKSKEINNITINNLNLSIGYYTVIIKNNNTSIISSKLNIY